MRQFSNLNQLRIYIGSDISIMDFNKIMEQFQDIFYLSEEYHNTYFCKYNEKFYLYFTDGLYPGIEFSKRQMELEFFYNSIKKCNIHDFNQDNLYDNNIEKYYNYRNVGTKIIRKKELYEFLLTIRNYYKTKQGYEIKKVLK